MSDATPLREETPSAGESPGSQTAAVEPDRVRPPPRVARAERSVFAGELRALTTGLVLVVTLVAFEALAVSTVMPKVEEDLGGLQIYGWAFSGFLLASLVGITWAGAMSDRGGLVRPFSLGLALLSTGLVIAALAPEMWVVVLGRCVQGLGAGAIPAIVYVVIARVYDEQQRPRIFALMSSAWVIPGLAGPALAGAVAEYAHWRLVFAGILPVLVIAVVMVVPALRQVRPAVAVAGVEVTRPQIPRALQLALGVAVALAGLTSGSIWLAVGGTALGAVVAAPALVTLMPQGTFRAAAGLPAAVLAMGVLNLSFFGASAFVPLIVTDVRGYSTVAAGVVVTSATMTWTLGTWLVDRLATRVSLRELATGGLLVLAAGIAAVTITLLDATPLWWAVIAWGIAGLGIGVTYPSCSLAVLRGAPSGGEGAASSAMKLNEVLGAALGTGIVGALVAAGEAAGWQTQALGLGFALMAGVSLVGVAVAQRLPGRGEGAAVRAAS